jgi:hypothetical protein
MTLDEPRDRRVIRPLLRRQHPERDVLLARSRAFAYSNSATIIAGL